MLIARTTVSVVRRLSLLRSCSNVAVKTLDNHPPHMFATFPLLTDSVSGLYNMIRRRYVVEKREHSTSDGGHVVQEKRTVTTFSSSDTPTMTFKEDGLEVARNAFQAAAKERVVIVHRGEGREVREMLSIMSNHGENVDSIHVSEAASAEIFRITGREALPLIFIKGDCAGGLAELRLLEEKGVVKNWLGEHKYDLVVIGGGSGGLAAAKEAARLGKKVACVDFVMPSTQGTVWGLGGTCVNVGCIPKKLMHRASILGEDINDARKFGWEIPEGEVKMNWSKMKQGVQDHIASLNWGYRVQLRERSVTYINAYGKFVDSHTLETKNKKGKIEMVTADRFIIATGLRPRFPDVPGALECCISSDDVFSLPYNPGKTLCVGASYVSLECAGFLKGMGNDVTVMVRSILLRGFDQDMAERIRKHMLDIGIKFVGAVPYKYEQIEKPTENAPGLVRVYHIDTLPDGSKRNVSEDFNTVLMAIGRDPVTDNMQLDQIGVKRSESGKIAGRNEQNTSCPYVYAIGDVLQGHPELTPVAIQAGKVLMRRLYTGNCEMTEYDKVPTTVFTPLEYGCCGLSEDAATEKYGRDNLNIYHGKFIPLEYTVPERVENQHCYLKLICLKEENDRVVGLHILSPNAGEITQGFALGFKFNATKADYDRLIGIHPTVAENFTTLTIVKEEGQEELKASSC